VYVERIKSDGTLILGDLLVNPEVVPG
jgi:hypothetical protein